MIIIYHLFDVYIGNFCKELCIFYTVLVETEQTVVMTAPHEVIETTKVPHG
jgi:hypothetical protein